MPVLLLLALLTRGFFAAGSFLLVFVRVLVGGCFRFEADELAPFDFALRLGVARAMVAV